MNSQPTIAIIGAGNMGSSLLLGLLANQYQAEKLWITDPDESKLKKIKEQFKVNVSSDNAQAVLAADLVILAVKPPVLHDVVVAIAPQIHQKKPLIISIAAGVREKSIQKWLGGNLAITRAMPNTPSLIGSGATALYANEFVSAEQRSQTESILRSVSQIIWIEDEKLMDIITALSGAGPAYFFLIIEALQEAAVDLGLPSKIAQFLTLQTAYGAARMALESNLDASALRKQVASPGGTTEQALRVLEEHRLREIIKKALEAGKKRSEEMAQLFDKPT